MTASFGTRVLDACLRRGQYSEKIRHDLVLVRDHVALADCDPAATLVGEEWRIQRITGELTLRDALPEASRLVAIVPPSFAPPLDIAGRSWMGKPVEVRADDIVTAITGRECDPLPEAEIGEAIVDSLDRLRVATSRWSQHGVVTAAEVRAVLVAAELGTDDRLDRERDADVLARWIVDRAPTTRIPDMLGRALVETHPRTGRWLAWVARTGDVPGLVAAGALGPLATDSAVEPLPRSSSEWRDLRGLVDLALRQAWKTAPDRARAALSTAENLAHRRRLTADEAIQLPLVRAALDQALFTFAQRCLAGHPPDDAVIDSLRANLHAPEMASEIAHVRDLARLARAASVPLPNHGDWASWARAARDHVGWIDLAIRRVRRAAGGANLEASRTILARAIARRDEWNRTFAHTLGAKWPAIAASKDLRAPLPLQHVTRSLVARLVVAGERVFLVVLDGCDLSTFTEIADCLPAGIGLCLPPVGDATLRDDLGAIGPFHVAISPVPTVTSHSRRALFAGEVPGNSALNDTEGAIANSSADKQAFARNGALAGIAHSLFLKGDLAQPDALLDALRLSADRVVGVVFNGVDDALSSKETTALGEWSLALLGGGAQDAIRVAVEQGWVVLVTADHGHTPYIDAGRKVAASAMGARFGAEPLPGSVAFEGGPLPISPLYLLTQIGEFVGPQHRGFHGGGGIEEVVVPLAFIGRVEGSQGRPRPPSWWWGGTAVEVALVEVSARVARVVEQAPMIRPAAILGDVGVQSALPADVAAALASQPLAISALEHLVRSEVLTIGQLATITRRPGVTVGGLMSKALAELQRAGISAPFVEEEAGGVRAYRWTGSRE